MMFCVAFVFTSVLCYLYIYRKDILLSIGLSIYEKIENTKRGYVYEKLGKIIRIDIRNKIIFLPFDHQLASSKKNSTILARFYCKPEKWCDITPILGVPFKYCPDDIEALEIRTKCDNIEHSYSGNQIVKWESKTEELLE